MTENDYHRIISQLGRISHIWRQDDCTFIANLDNDEKIIETPLAEIENLTDKNDFLRIHRSHIINIHDLIELNEMGNKLVAVLKNGKEIPISKRRKKELLQKLDILE